MYHGTFKDFLPEYSPIKIRLMTGYVYTFLNLYR